jgi:uroporphyrinogen-III synthase
MMPSSIPALVLRPEPGCTATVTAARELGLDARAFPLFAVRPVSWSPPPADEIDALLLGSANALRHAGPALALYAGKPAWCVGETTAEAARGAGLDVRATGKGGLQPVVDQIDPQHRRLLRLCGSERVELVLPPGTALIERVVYASLAQPLPVPAAELLGGGALVLLHSGEAAAHFSRECERLGLPRKAIALAALGPRIAAAAGTGWKDLQTAATAEDSALLALVCKMCHSKG